MSDDIILYIDNNRQKINSLQIGGQTASSPSEKYTTKDYILSSDLTITSNFKIRSAINYGGKLLVAGDFGLLYQDDDGAWKDYIKFSDGGDKYAINGWLENAIYHLSVMSDPNGDKLCILGNFETFTLNPDSETEIFSASSKNLLIITEQDGIQKLAYQNIKEYSNKLPIIRASNFNLVNTDLGDTEDSGDDVFADDDIVSIYGYNNKLFIIDKGIYSFKDIEINNYGIISSNQALDDPSENLYILDFSQPADTALTTKYIRGEILSDINIDNKIYISTGLNKEIDGTKYHQTLYYILDVINNVLTYDKAFNQKTIKSLPVNSQQSYIVTAQEQATTLSNTTAEAVSQIIEADRIVNGSSNKNATTFFGNGSRSNKLRTNGLQEDDNIYSRLKIKIKGLLTISFNMRWLIVNQIPSNLKIVILKNNDEVGIVNYDNNDRNKSISFNVDIDDEVSFLVDSAYYTNFVIDFEAFVDNISTFYAKGLSFINYNPEIAFTAIHNGIHLPNIKKQNSAVLLDTNNNVWFLKPETKDYFVSLSGYEDSGDRLVKYNLPSYIQPVDVVLGDDVVAVLSSDGNIYTWGKNTFGQLGNSQLGINTTIDQTPVKVDGSGFVSIFVCNNTFYAIDSGNRMYAWGSNVIYSYKINPSLDTDAFTEETVREKIGTGIIYGYNGDYTNTPVNIVVGLGLGSTPLNRSCGILDDQNNLNLAGQQWSTVSISPVDVYAIDTLGLMYYWGGKDSNDDLVNWDYSKSYLRPRIIDNGVLFIGSPGYTISYLTAAELSNLYQASNNYYYTSTLSDFILNGNAQNATQDSDLDPFFENRAIDFIQLKNEQYKFELIAEDKYIFYDNLLVKNVRAGDTICQIKISDKTLANITDANGISIVAAYQNVVAKYNGLVMINLDYINQLSGNSLIDSSFDNMTIFYYNCYQENFDRSNPGSYSRVFHDSYFFENKFSNTASNIFPVINGYNRTSKLSHQMSSILLYEDNTGYTAWSKNAIDKDSRNSAEAFNSLKNADFFTGYNTDSLFDHELIKYTHQESVTLKESLYHNNHNFSANATIDLRFRIFDNTCGTRMYNLASLQDGQIVDLDQTEKTHDAISSLNGFTNIRLTSLDNVSSLIKVDSNRKEWNLFTEDKPCVAINSNYAIATDGKIYVLPYGGENNNASKYNFAFVLPDKLIYVNESNNLPNFVDSAAIVGSLIMYLNYIIVGGYFPEGNSQINKDNSLMVWDHYQKRVLQPYTEPVALPPFPTEN